MASLRRIFWTSLLTVLFTQVRAANFSCCSGQGTCGGAVNDPVVCSVLADVFEDLGGRSWANNTGWAAAANGIPTDFCTFYSSPVRPAGAAGAVFLTYGSSLRTSRLRARPQGCSQCST